MDPRVVPLNATVVGPLLTELSDGLDPETCQLLGGFALIIQAVMGLLVIASLLLKRAREKPRRKWKVWMADISKQVLGQAFVHGSNVLISDMIASHSKKSDNPCSLYALNVGVDTTVGVLILFGFLRLFTQIALSFRPSDFKTGDYGIPFSWEVWGKQASLYVFCLGLMKIVVVAIFWIIPDLIDFANWALSFLTSDEAQVLVVMLIFPLVMNVLQFLIIDSMLKSKAPTSLSPSNPEDDESRAFLDNSTDEPDDDEPFAFEAAISPLPFALNLDPKIISGTPESSGSTVVGVQTPKGDKDEVQEVLYDHEEEDGLEDGERTPTALRSPSYAYPPSNAELPTPKAPYTSYGATQKWQPEITSHRRGRSNESISSDATSIYMDADDRDGEEEEEEESDGDLEDEVLKVERLLDWEKRAGEVFVVMPNTVR